jgi:exodeoxyribonuclease VII small subunit
VKTSNKESVRYQDMLREVESIVESVGDSNLDLDEMVQKIERGYDLIKNMRDRLETTKSRIEKLRVEFDTEMQKPERDSTSD